jgi:hypothetical protein
MDTYLPADFHTLHDDAPTDWRDISSTCKPDAPTRTMLIALVGDVRRAEDLVDPSWYPL